jgi:hypothetical protein
MSWTHSQGGPAEASGERLAAARDAFREAQRVLEDARQDLLHAHTETARLWTAGR